MRTVRIITNDYVESQEICSKIKEDIQYYGFDLEVVEDDIADICIVIGGDGAFLKACRISNYKPDSVYVGVNTGSIGFLQEVTLVDVLGVLQSLSENKEKITKIPILNIEFYINGKKQVYKAINEIEIGGMYDKVFDFTQYVHGKILHDVKTSGIIISTSTGSTALNKSYGGPILLIEDAIVSTLRGATKSTDSRSYLNQPIVCKETILEFPDIKEQRAKNPSFNRFRNEVYFTIDGEVLKGIDTNGLTSIWINLCDYSLKKLVLNRDDTRVSKIRSKLL